MDVSQEGADRPFKDIVHYYAFRQAATCASPVPKSVAEDDALKEPQEGE
jgi:hypothetical protein